mmetsp:Transcript_79370/g.246154  ORF Transcript_79370/g.246154 Transcript_79370/m.246154 type:complete len:426 (-) Transcript_79370:49-1326(-)
MQSAPRACSRGSLPAALLLLQCCLPAGAALLRHAGTAARTAVEEGDVAANSSIQEKWDKMDDFVGIMFKLACQWKHGKDVNGLAAEKLENGEIDRTEVVDFKAKTQAENVQYLKGACGRIVAKGQGKCRQGCAGRWGNAKGKRAECDLKCVTAYSTFESNCKTKADDLKMVYEAKLSAAAARKQCHEGHCAQIQTVWMKESEAEMQREATAQCGNLCTADKVKLACQRKWLLEVDFLRPGIKSACFAEGQAKVCFDGEKATASTAHGQCASTGKGSCDSQYTTCKQQGKTDATFKDAQAFCDNRKKMCEAQVTQQCHEEHQKALEAAKDKCEKADAQALDTCVASKLDAKETAEKSKCESERTTACPKDCLAKCNVAALSKCLGNLKSSHDEAEMFCEDFWRLLHESSEVDPVTGDPIVLMAMKP